MAALVPVIHVGTFKSSARLRRPRLRTHVAVLNPTRSSTAWMPGTSPGMTRTASIRFADSARMRSCRDDHQRAPNPVSMVRSVFRTISMSSQIEKFLM
jgi:hypothetical protein